MAEPTLPLTGGCLCGQVRFEISEPLLASRYCHCTRCQRRTGTGFSVSGQTVPGSFRVTQGEELVRAFDPGDGGWRKAFCTSCGGHLYSEDPGEPANKSVRLGVIDGEPGVRPSAHQFADYAPPWSPVPDDGLVRFGERMPEDFQPPAGAR